MENISTALPLPSEGQEDPGHGRHRGPVSAEEHEASVHGRHRKPSEQAEQSGTGAWPRPGQ
ncbi:hypothetical protein [Streptomyces nodosus]|uniref:hypothetical protein n=1 Tax=Streptomyces nodosus TaxID=40318 RepID=UPI00381B32B9